jgi:hypothetical protein
MLKLSKQTAHARTNEMFDKFTKIKIKNVKEGKVKPNTTKSEQSGKTFKETANTEAK